MELEKFVFDHQSRVKDIVEKIKDKEISPEDIRKISDLISELIGYIFDNIICR